MSEEALEAGSQGEEEVFVQGKDRKGGGLNVFRDLMDDLLSPGLSPVTPQKVTICPRIRKRFGRSVDDTLGVCWLGIYLEVRIDIIRVS